MRQPPPIAYIFPGGAEINETVYGAGFATRGELYTLSRTMEDCSERKQSYQETELKR